MPYFKDTNNEIYFLDDSSFLNLLPSNCIKITDEEAELLKNPPKTQEEIQAEVNAQARAYLNSTDWYVVRFAETGVAIPQDILNARQAARERIV